MSKPDAAGAKSLEEILASIRKSLSGEGGDASGGARSGAPKQTQAAPEASPLPTGPTTRMASCPRGWPVR